MVDHEDLLLKTSIVLGLFAEGLMSNDDVVLWADNKIKEESDPDECLFELSLNGVGRDTRLRECSFPKSREFTFLEIFSLRVVAFDFNLENEPEDFVSWIVDASLGKDVSIPEVHFGYLLDHYFFECNDIDFAVEYLQKEIKQFYIKSKPIADAIWKEIK